MFQAASYVIFEKGWGKFLQQSLIMSKSHEATEPVSLRCVYVMYLFYIDHTRYT